MSWAARLCLVTCLVAGCGPKATVGEGADSTSSATDGTQSSSDPGTTTTLPTHGPGTTTTTTTDPGTVGTTSTHGQDTTTSEPVDPCAGIAVPQPPFEYDEGHAERVDTDRIAVELELKAEYEGDVSYRWVFELGPDEAVPGVYTVPVEQQCYYDCNNPDFTEDAVIEVVSIDECLSAAFLEAPESGCTEFFLWGCGGFVEPIQ